MKRPKVSKVSKVSASGLARLAIHHRFFASILGKQPAEWLRHPYRLLVSDGHKLKLPWDQGS